MRLAQSDIREQLAKGAIAAGVRILLSRLGATIPEVTRVYLAGAFGNYVSHPSARRIGLLDFPLDKIEPAGNTALLGAKLALFSPGAGQELHTQIRRVTEHLSLAADPSFQDTYVDEMFFQAPEGAQTSGRVIFFMGTGFVQLVRTEQCHGTPQHLKSAGRVSRNREPCRLRKGANHRLAPWRGSGRHHIHG